MAKIDLLSNKISFWEGGYENNPSDMGCFNSKGENVGSNRGIAAKTFEQMFGYCPTEEDMRNITEEQYQTALEHFGKQIRFNDITNQSIGEIYFDWAWASGAYYPTLHVQRIVGTDADGIVGQHTIDAINNYADQEELFNKIKDDRITYIGNLVESNPSFKVFEQGWLNRVLSYDYSE